MKSHVRDVMTRDVVSVRETAEYKDITAVMRELHMSAFPVLDPADHLVGVVSEADLLLKEVGQEALTGYLVASGRRGERAKAAGVTAAQLMTSPAVIVGPGSTRSTTDRCYPSNPAGPRSQLSALVPLLNPPRSLVRW
jgi:CBS-domain-containing membrane protein